MSMTKKETTIRVQVGSKPTLALINLIDHQLNKHLLIHVLKKVSWRKIFQETFQVKFQVPRFHQMFFFVRSDGFNPPWPHLGRPGEPQDPAGRGAWRPHQWGAELREAPMLKKSAGGEDLKMFEAKKAGKNNDIWRYLKIFEDIWRYLKIFEDIWRYLKIFEDIWYISAGKNAGKFMVPKMSIELPKMGFEMVWSSQNGGACHK